jgi:uncharacterized protein YigE (DUF2233 family)
MSDVLQREDFDCGRLWFRESFRHWICHVDVGSVQRERNGVRVKGQSKNRMEVSPRNIQFKSFANGFAILLQTFLPQSRRLTGF